MSELSEFTKSLVHQNVDVKYIVHLLYSAFLKCTKIVEDKKNKNIDKYIRYHFVQSCGAFRKSTSKNHINVEAVFKCDLAKHIFYFMP
jgi:hypothetical protein